MECGEWESEGLSKGLAALADSEAILLNKSCQEAILNVGSLKNQ